MESHSWTCYSGAALALALINTAVDFTRGAALVHAGHWIAGAVIYAIVIASGIASWIGVSMERCQSRYRVDMAIHKWIFLAFQWWINCCHPYFQSASQLVFQLNLIWRGIHVHPIQHLIEEDYIGTLDWFQGLLIVLSLIANLTALVLAFLHDNRERSGSRLISALLSTIFGVLLRSYLLSMLLAIKPLAFCVTLLSCYIVNVCVMKYINREGWSCFVDAYCSLLTPTGYARLLGSATRNLSKSPWETTTEVERVKLNQEKMCKNYKMSQAKYGTLTGVIGVTYVCMVEFYIMTWTFTFMSTPQILASISNRKFLYITPVVMLLFRWAFSSWHLQQMKRARDAARTWHTLTPHKTQSRVAFNRKPKQTRLEFVQQNAPIIRPSAPPPKPPTPPPLQDNNGLAASVLASHQRLLNPTAVSMPVMGTYKFHKEDCVTCDMLNEGTTFKSTMSGKEYKFLPTVSCNDRSVIYLVTCANPKCSKQYVGKTEQELRQRHYGHRREIEKKSSLMGTHFAESCGYTSFRIQVIDQIHESDANKRKKELQRREGYWQHELSTFVPMGLNTRDEAPSDENKP